MDLPVIFSVARFTLLRKVVHMGVDWIIAVLQATSNVANGWGRLVSRDWAWLKAHNSIDMREWSDADDVFLFLAVCPLTR